MNRCARLLIAALALAASPVGAQNFPCAGDCDGDGRTSAHELVRGVRILLGEVDLSECALIDSNDDDFVAITDLLIAVRSAIEGCASTAASRGAWELLGSIEQRACEPIYLSGPLRTTDGAAMRCLRPMTSLDVVKFPTEAAAEARWKFLLSSRVDGDPPEEVPVGEFGGRLLSRRLAPSGARPLRGNWDWQYRCWLISGHWSGNGWGHGLPVAGSGAEAGILQQIAESETWGRLLDLCD